jgi:signal transduction histidine kinase
MKSILYNLISNAVKYRRADIKTIIRIHTYMENGSAVLWIEDNGLGIDLKKYQNDIFKLNKTFHQGFDSKGIGLFITKNQIENFGGSIQAESEPMKDSIFTVIF